MKLRWLWMLALASCNTGGEIVLPPPGDAGAGPTDAEVAEDAGALADAAELDASGLDAAQPDAAETDAAEPDAQVDAGRPLGDGGSRLDGGRPRPDGGFPTDGGPGGRDGGIGGRDGALPDFGVAFDGSLPDFGVAFDGSLPDFGFSFDGSIPDVSLPDFGVAQTTVHIVPGTAMVTLNLQPSVPPDPLNVSVQLAFDNASSTPEVITVMGAGIVGAVTSQFTMSPSHTAPVGQSVARVDKVPNSGTPLINPGSACNTAVGLFIVLSNGQSVFDTVIVGCVM